MDQALLDYEDSVLALVADHHGKILYRARSDGAHGHPLEVQLLEWASEAALDGYMSDPRRTALASNRDRAIKRTEIMTTQIV
jgi:hypothetical protein